MATPVPMKVGPRGSEGVFAGFGPHILGRIPAPVSVPMANPLVLTLLACPVFVRPIARLPCCLSIETLDCCSERPLRFRYLQRTLSPLLRHWRHCRRDHSGAGIPKKRLGRTIGKSRVARDLILVVDRRSSARNSAGQDAQVSDFDTSSGQLPATRQERPQSRGNLCERYES